MTKSRLARISLIVAALGLNVAPAILGASAQAAEKAAPAPEAPKDVVRPEMYKLIDPAQIKELMAAKNFTEVKNRIDQAAALPNVTPYEGFILNQMRVQLGSASANNALLLPALEAMIESGRMQGKDKLNLIKAAGEINFSAKDYDKAIAWFKRYIDEGGEPAGVRGNIVRSYFFKNDFATTKTEVLKDITEAEAAGKSPTNDDLTLLGNVAIKTKDNGLYLQAVEYLVKYYPSDAYWNDLLNRTRGKDGYSNRFDIDIDRLKALTAPSKMEPEDWAELADLASFAGFFTEAKAAMDKGYPDALPGGKEGAQLKALRDKINKGAADDAKNLEAGIPAAQKSKDGVGLVNLGYIFVTQGQADKGLELMKQGLAKGVAKNPEDAKLRYGYALAQAGKREEALEVLKSITGKDGRGDIARYWTILINKPAAK